MFCNKYLPFVESLTCVLMTQVSMNHRKLKEECVINS